MQNNFWNEVWERHVADENILLSKDVKKTLVELKRSSGYDVLGGAGKYEWWFDEYQQIKHELFYTGNRNKGQIKSVYEVGCGSGAKNAFQIYTYLRKMAYSAEALIIQRVCLIVPERCCNPRT